MATNNTPPGSVFVPPLTPPPTVEKPLSKSTQNVVNRFRLHREGYRPGPWWEGRVRPNDYTQVLHVLDADRPLQKYVDDKLRYDYDPCRSRLTIRMPSPLHDTFCARIVDEISRQIRQYQQNGGPAANFAKEVEHFATSRILIPEDRTDGKQTYSRREPDASFGHRRAHYPGVIVEVCYSQKSRRVAHIADEYILNTGGSVNAVVAFDVDYEGSKRATITVWRPEYTTVDGVQEFRATAIVEAEPFRMDTGIPAERTGLRLSLSDFATEELSQGHVGLDQEIFITSEQLCDFLSSAESRQQAQALYQGSINQIRPGALKRRRLETPPELPSSEDEGSIEKNRESKRGRQSSDFRPSSSSTNSTLLNS
ncbi:hypothetical protein N7499_011050 [Penicillium canescens]|nr:hypothetical protein N7499_011050 [Penicillium canescens]KAJ6182787.1 hypothetical protein N7485_001429 [Penicillium canescens]